MVSIQRGVHVHWHAVYRSPSGETLSCNAWAIVARLACRAGFAGQHMLKKCFYLLT